MLKLGAAALLAAIIKAAIIVALTIGGAAALTHYVALPEPLGTLVWILAIGYSLLCLLTVAIVIGALAVAGKATPTVGRPAPPRRVRGRKLH